MTNQNRKTLSALLVEFEDAVVDHERAAGARRHITRPRLVEARKAIETLFVGAAVSPGALPRAIARQESLAILLSGRGVVRSDEIAAAFGVSKRTIYRDVEALRDRGADIPGRAGEGYRLKAGPILPAIVPAPVPTLPRQPRKLRAGGQPG